MKLFNFKKKPSLIEQWDKIFPNRCIICAYWRFGRNNFLTNKLTPIHNCKENKVVINP